MSAIKKFFEKKSLEGKFKKAGQGKRLTDQAANPQTSSSKSMKDSNDYKRKKQNEMTDEKKMAATAALARLELKKENESKGYSSKGMTMKAELIAEQKEAEARARKYSLNKPLNLDTSKVVSGVYFTCPTLGLLQPMLKERMEEEVEQFLLSQLVEEPELTSTLMIHTLNKNKQDIKTCLEMLSKYLSNIIRSPDEIAYRKIKATNRVLNEKVLKCKGASEFLQAVGFERRVVGDDDGEGEEFLMLDMATEHKEDTVERLRDLLEVISASEPVPLQLYRDIKIFNLQSTTATGSSSNHHQMEVPLEFYNIHPDELKREQKMREEAVKEMGMLVTKEMRERERLKGLRKYRYAVIRVRLPDEFMVQGTFKAWESFGEVRLMMSEMMADGSVCFKLASRLGCLIDEDDKSLAELNLVPASLLMLTFEAGSGCSSRSSGGGSVLKKEYRDQAEQM